MPKNVPKRFSLKSVVVLCVPLLAALPGHVVAQTTSRAQFVADVAPSISRQLCDNEQSPLRKVYTGALENCEAALNKHVDVCAKKVVPEIMGPSTDGMEIAVLTAQCLVAHYQGGDELKLYNANFTGKLVLQKKQWLANLQPVMMRQMCTQMNDDFARAYKGGNCEQDVKLLFEKCTTNVDNVVIPPTIASLKEANHHGQVIASCITAHYIGGEALRSFKSIKAE